MRILISLFVIIGNYLCAQSVTSSTYGFQTGTSSLTPQSGFVSIIGSNNANGVSGLVSFGGNFKFNYSGVSYDSFSVSVSGWIKLGSVGTTQSTSVVSSSVNYPVIVPYGAELTTSSGGFVGYQIIGTFPYRVCVIQWQSVKDSPYLLTPVTFEARLYESSGRIEFVYGGIPQNYDGYTIGIGATFNSVNSFGSVSVINPSTSSWAYYNNQVNNTIQISAGTLFQFVPDSTNVPQPINLATSASAACITLSFQDNSNNEYLFEIWRSTDSVNYYLIDTIVSSNTPGTGAVYSLTDTGLFYSTAYHYRIIARNFGSMINGWSSISDTTTLPSLSGIKYIPGDYASISNAIDDINCRRLAGPIILQLKTTYNSNAERFPIILPGDTITSINNTITIRPDTNVTSQLIYWANPIAVFNFDRSANIIIDGRPGGVGSSRSLTIKNILNTSPALKFVNDAHNINVKYCNIVSADSLTNDGVINIGGTSLSNGNDKIVFEYCEIGYNGFRPVFLVTSIGTPGKENDSICFMNCQIHSFYRSGNNNQFTAAIHIGDGNTKWIIKGNSFYQNNIVTGASMNFVRIQAPNGTGFDISDNYFGGSSLLCGGSNCVFSGSGLVHFIYMDIGGSGLASIQNNVFDNFTLNINTSLAINHVIQIISGKVRIGDQYGNRFGNSSGFPSIFLDAGNSDIIFIQSNAADSLWINNNSISGIKATGSSPHNISGIYTINTKFLEVRNNLIGHPILPDAIASFSQGQIIGIEFYYPSNGGLVHIVDNIISNIGLYNTVLQSGNEIFGIASHRHVIPSGVSHNLIENNVIHTLITWGGNTNGSSVLGIAISFNQGQTDIISNKVFDLQSFGVSSGQAVTGIYASSFSNSVANISGNFVYSLSVENSLMSLIFGIGLSTQGTVTNNMISLGYKSNGSDYTGDASIYALDLDATNNSQSKKVFHNSIFVGGLMSRYSSSTAIYSTGNSADSLYDNILENTRSSSVGVGVQHTCIIIQNASLDKLDYNLYYCVGNQSGYVNGYTNLALWQVTGQDVNSLAGDPAFINPTGDTSSVNLHLQPITWAEGMGYFLTSVVDDFDRQNRNVFSPVDIGADCGNFLSTNTNSDFIMAPVLVFPNPFSDVFFIKADLPITSVELFSLDGRLLSKQFYSAGQSTVQIDQLSHLSSGGYFANIVTSDSTEFHVKINKE